MEKASVRLLLVVEVSFLPVPASLIFNTMIRGVGLLDGFGGVSVTCFLALLFCGSLWQEHLGLRGGFLFCAGSSIELRVLDINAPRTDPQPFGLSKASPMALSSLGPFACPRPADGPFAFTWGGRRFGSACTSHARS